MTPFVTMLDLASRLALWLFPASEIYLAVRRRASGAGASARDRRSMLMLWLTFGAGVGAAWFLAHRPWLRMGLPLAARQTALIVCMGAGMAVRWQAIRTLGRFFTVDVAIHAAHQVVDRGPYAWVRHPSYTGLLLEFLGLSFAFGTWAGLAALMATASVAVALRIRVEEAALLHALGEPYRDYCRRTKRVVPGLI